MDTKWKNRLNIIAWLILFTFGISGVFTSFFNNNEYMKTSYFKTTMYEDLESHLLENIQTFEMYYKSKEDTLSSLSVTNEEIEEYRYQNGDLADQVASIEEQYEIKINDAMVQENQKVIDYYTKERDKKIEDITKNFESDEYIKEKILKEKKQRVDEYYRELEGYRKDYSTYKEAFAYYLKDTESGEVYTNLSTTDESNIDKYINDENMYFVHEYGEKKGYLHLNFQGLVIGLEDINNESVGKSAILEGKIALSKNAPSSNAIIASYQDYKNQQKAFLLYSILSLLALVISIIIGKKQSMLKRLTPDTWKSLYQKIPLDVAIILFFVTSYIAILLIFDLDVAYYDFLIVTIIYHLIIKAAFVGITLIQGVYLYSRLKNSRIDKQLWNHSLIMQIVNMFRNAFLNRRVGTQVFIILTIVFFFGVGTLLVVVFPVFLLIYVPAFFLVALPLFFFIMKRTGYFNEILANTNALAQGQFEPDLEIIGKSVFASLARDINIMKHGVKTSQKAQAKSERLKTELITNVSHDLRTPLTSIITYSELLKNPTLSVDERNSYIEIIDRKSKRLKVLIDDLFEASKMASGNIQLTKVKVDIVQLLQQALAEYNETIQQSHLTFRVSQPEAPVYALVDGQKLWRVFDNLIGNIIKYSLENTRAYITITTENNKAVIIFKNVSRYELSEDTDELFERFKRGDKSRNTDGSGLGLAIAKSIIDLHEGTLDLDVDGDLFKVTIVLDLLDEEE